jgi:hypothetical protein
MPAAPVPAERSRITCESTTGDGGCTSHTSLQHRWTVHVQAATSCNTVQEGSCGHRGIRRQRCGKAKDRVCAHHETASNTSTSALALKAQPSQARVCCSHTHTRSAREKLRGAASSAGPRVETAAMGHLKALHGLVKQQEEDETKARALYACTAR